MERVRLCVVMHNGSRMHCKSEAGAITGNRPTQQRRGGYGLVCFSSDHAIFYDLIVYRSTKQQINMTWVHKVWISQVQAFKMR